MVGIALLGAGIFAREEHLPAIEAAENLNLLAIYSRSQKSVDALASQAKSSVDKYYDSPSESGKSLDDLLARSDIEAVIIVLPINNQPEVIKKALSAGKHVLSEKPVAKDVATAKELIGWYRSLSNPPIWAVAENFRYTESLVQAAKAVKDLGGKVVTFHLKRYGYVKETDKYFNTEWRKVPGYQGGFLLDGGVHFVAGLRLLLGAAGEEVSQVASFASLLVERLGPVDTVHAVATTKSGVSGTITITFGTEHKSGLEIEVVTTNGTVTWSQEEVVVSKKSQKFQYSSGVKAEVAVFGKSIESKTPDPKQTPEEAFADLQFLESLLESKGQVKAIA
ncbi:NAD(P)-binding protein [Coniochaeta sp. PMI_546]|nr:NAD(P)-binding protein [Coniochaeta sp. PMI_546]